MSCLDKDVVIDYNMEFVRCLWLEVESMSSCMKYFIVLYGPFLRCDELKRYTHYKSPQPTIKNLLMKLKLIFMGSEKVLKSRNITFLIKRNASHICRMAVEISHKF